MNKLQIATQMARATTGDVYKVGPKDAARVGMVPVESDKYRYKRFALSVLRGIAKALQLPKGSFDLRFNPGGPAVGGEATLHHEAFYLQICDTGVMWRTCKGRKDYGGSASSGANRWAVGFGETLTVDELVEQIRSVLPPSVAV